MRPFFVYYTDCKDGFLRFCNRQNCYSTDKLNHPKEISLSHLFEEKQSPMYENPVKPGF